MFRNISHFLSLIILLNLIILLSCSPAVYESADTCTDSALLFWRLAKPFFHDQYAVSIGAFKDNSKDFSINLLECAMNRILFPMKYYLREQFILSPTHKSGVFRQKTTQGFILMSENEYFIEQRLKLIAKRDPNTKMILILTNATSDIIKTLLKLAWHQYNVLDLFICVATRRFEKKYDIDVYAYDPFTISNHKRGFVHHFQLRNSTILIEEILNMMRKRLINIQGYPINVCIFNSTGTVSPLVDQNGEIQRYISPNGNLIFLLLRTMNFTPFYYNPPDNDRFGYLYPDGRMTGALYEIDNARADILGNIRPVIDYGQKESEFLFPVDEMGFAFLVPKQDESTAISFLQVFDQKTSIALTSAFVLMVTMWNYLQWMYHKKFEMKSSRNLTFIEICHLLFGTMLLISQSGSRRLSYERCLFASMIMFSMVNCYVYQGKMVEHLSTSKKSQDINTLEDLAKTDLSIVTVTGFKDLMKDIASEEEGPRIYRELYKRQELIDNITEIIRRVAVKRDSASLFNYFGSRVFELKLYSKSTGKYLVHVLKDGPPQRYNSHMVPKTSPYKDRFNFILMKIRESGLMKLWNENEYYETLLTTLKRPRSDENDLNGIYTMKQLDFIFISWLTCCSFCILVFIVEILRGKQFGRTSTF